MRSIFIVLILILTGCGFAPLYNESKNTSVSFNVTGQDDLLVHRVERELDRYSHFVCTGKSITVKLEIIDQTSQPLVYKQNITNPGTDQERKHMDVNRWHMRLFVKYIVEVDNKKIHDGILRVRHSFQDRDDFGNLFLEDKGKDKLISDLAKDLISEVQIILRKANIH